MKPLKKQKLIMAFLSLMLLCSDMTFMPVKADPETEDTTTDDTTGGDTNQDDTTSGDNTTGDGTTGDNAGNDNTTNGGTTTEEQEPVYVPSSINTLDSLKVIGYELSPEFSSSVNEYSLTVDASVKKIEITATKDDYRSSVSGTGEFDVSWQTGSYDFKIVCTSESGRSNSYVIHLTVSSDPYLFVAVGGESLGFVLKGLDELTNIPEGFEKEVGSYSGEEITVFNNDAFPFSLVYLQNENKKEDWYCYQDGVVTGSFVKLMINKTVYYYAGVSDSDKKQDGYTYKEVTVSGEKLNGWQVKADSNKIMLYLYDSQGNGDYYIYDTDTSTMQRRREYEVTETKENRGLLKSPVVITVIIVVVIAAVFGFIFLKDGKKNGVDLNKKKKREEDDFDEGKFDHTVELVRTGKIKIFADPKDDVSEVEKTKEFKVEDFKEEPKVTSLIEEMMASQEEVQIVEETIEEIKKEEIEEIKTEDTKEIKEEPQQPKEKKSFFFKKKKEVQEEVVETNSEEIEPLIQEAAQDETVEETEISQEEPIKKEKKSFFFKKKKEAQEEMKEEVKEEVSEPVEDVEEEEIVEIKEEMPAIPEVDELEAMKEIQKYIDDLFYLDEKKD